VKEGLLASTAITPPAESQPDGRAAQAAEDLKGLGKDRQLLVVTQEPLNVETPLHLLDTPLTPVERMFMRNNHELLAPDAGSWSLTIDGLVRQPLTLTLADLLELPAQRYAAVLECSGNGRSAFAEAGTPTEGLPWNQGAVACAEWSGAPLSLIFERAGVEAAALQAECAGDGAEPFVRGVDVSKLIGDALLAYAVNGQPIPAAHGGPVRLVVPGWGGVNWVKWLSHMRLIPHESQSPFNQERYVRLDAAGQLIGKVRELQVKSIITGPSAGARLDPGPVEVKGWAWSAGKPIVRVEVSADGGATWHDAELGDESLGPWAWRRFSWRWEAASGEHILAARATDSAGDTQPTVAPFNLLGYLNNAIQKVPVEVR
jgi:sulfite oxidase